MTRTRRLVALLLIGGLLAMATAPLTTGWQRRMRNPAGPLMGSSGVLGVPFLQATPGFAALYPNARMVVEMAFGAVISADPTTWNWTDVTTDVRQNDGQTINIAPMGRGDVTERTQPAACTLQLDNSSGKYSRGPQSSSYPNIHQNIPLRVWVTLTGSVNDMEIQFQGEAWSLKPSWNKKGNIAVVDVKAAGKLRQLTQGATPLRSPLYRSLSTASDLVAYWPMEDGTDAIWLANGLLDGLPMHFTGLNLASNTGMPGSAPTPVFSSSGGSLGPVAIDSTKFTGQWQVDFYMYMPVTPAADAIVMQLAGTGTVKTWQLYMNAAASNEITLWGFDANGTLIVNTFGILVGMLIAGQWVRVTFTATQSGGNVNWFLIFYQALGHTAAGVSGSYAGTVGGLSSHQVPPQTSVANISIAHLSFYNTYNRVGTGLPARGYFGETATARLARLSAEQGVPINITGTSTTTMGVQSIATFVDLLRECEAADLGVLGDGLGPGLYYVSRSARYNLPVSLVLDAAAADLADAPQPEDDDQKVRNLYNVKRKNGSSATFADTTGPLGTNAIGTYDSSAGSDLVLDSDAPLLNIAAWLVHLGTVEGYRYPTLPIDLRNIPDVTPVWAAMSPGARVQVINISTVSPQHPVDVVDLLAEGWTQRLSPFIWDAVLNCSPAQPWDVDALNVNFRLEMAGQMLAADLAPGATSLSLATATGHQLFTTSATYPADFPMNLVIGGWRIHVTSSVGAGSPQTLTCDPTPNTAPIPAGTAVTLWRPASLAL